MALETATNFKAAIATAAADITTAWSDTVLTEIAADIRNNHHPLRNLKKLFSVGTLVVHRVDFSSDVGEGNFMIAQQHQLELADRYTQIGLRHERTLGLFGPLSSV